MVKAAVGAILFVLSVNRLGNARVDPLFSPAERARIVAFWNAPGRYRVDLPPDPMKTGPWKVGVTPDGSKWLHAYQKAVGAARIPPTQDASAAAEARPDTAEWEKWVAAKVAWDRWQAQRECDAANAESGATVPEGGAAQPPNPGPIPAGLLAAVSNPPAFAYAVSPKRHTIAFEDGEAYEYVDNVLFAHRPRYAYFRFPQGTVAYGTRLKDMPEEELKGLFSEAGFNPSEQRIAMAVSKLEGGFETVNTYDTGYVSIGFIQFVTLDDGKHSLIEVMAREKADRPDAFEKDFRRYGLDVSPDGVIVVVDPATGAELGGHDAVMRIVEDKRLTAVFQRAGRHSRPFRVAQIAVAKSHYWPAEDSVTVMVDGQPQTGRVADVVRSEAGLATLYDRKVNRGVIDPFPAVLQRVMDEHRLKTIAEASAYEREIVSALKYRTDFLQDPSLSQPK